MATRKVGGSEGRDGTISLEYNATSGLSPCKRPSRTGEVPPYTKNDDAKDTKAPLTPETNGLNVRVGVNRV